MSIDTSLVPSPLVISFLKENVGFCGIRHFNNGLTFVPAVNQLQQTLVSIQELLVQQQQKIQELSRELSAAEVTTLNHLNTLKQL